jgi:cell division protein FtsW
MKMSLIIYFANYFEKKIDLIRFGTITGLVLFLVMLEPDLGTAVIITSISLCLYFVAGAPVKHMLKILAVCLVIGPLLILVSPYRKQRLLTFLNSSFDVQGASYHIRQILIALGSGGIFGRGLGQSRQKFLFLPEVTTDSIFAIIAEEFGFIGASILILLFVIMVLRGIRIALLTRDSFLRLLVTGIIFFIGIQALINLGAMVALVPLTGVPLPFISYGGSSLMICLAGMGIVYNVSRKIN